MILRSLARGALAVVLTALPLAAQEVPDSVRLPRLAALGRLYTTVRFFHPTLGYLGVAWDQATATAADAVHDADTRDGYAAALTELLGTLADPRTRVVDTTIPWESDPNQPAVSHRWTTDSTLIVSILPPAIGASAEVAAGVAVLLPLFQQAQAIVFDLRAPPGWPAHGDVDHALGQSAVTRALFPNSIIGPGERTRLHEGYAPDRPAQASAVFREGWHQAAGPLYEGSETAHDVRLIFLVNGDSELPRFALAARALGLGTIVGDGEASRSLGGTSQRLALTDGLVAEVRVGELVNGDGTIAVAVDTVLTSSDASDAPLATALVLARTPWRQMAPRLAPPISPPAPEPDSARTRFPTRGQRLAGLYRLWGAVEYFHAYPEHHTAPWDSALERYIPRVEAARDSMEYAIAIAELMTTIGDSHGGVQAPGLRALLGPAPLPFKARMVAGRPVVTRLAADSLAPGLALGDELVSIDGEAIAARMARIGRLIAASTPQARARDALTRALLGADGSVATLRVRGANAVVRTVRVARRTAFQALLASEREGPVFRLLPGNIGYADLDRLNPADVDSMFTLFRGACGIVFDMRGYPRETAWEIAPRLTAARDVVAARFTLPMARRPKGLVVEEQAGERLRAEFEQRIPAGTGALYRGRTVMLIDERTQSQAEHTGLFLEAANGTAFIGTPSAGANGDVTNVELPGGLVAWFTGLAVRHADGRPLQQVGLTPTIRVAPTLAGLRAGRDEVLDRALLYLRTGR